MARVEVSRGDLWRADWSPGRGSEQVGKRPALIVQTDAANHNPRYPNTIVVAVSTKGRDVPFHIPLAATDQSGLSSPSFAKCEQVLTIGKNRLDSRIGSVSEHELAQVEAALHLVLDL